MRKKKKENYHIQVDGIEVRKRVEHDRKIKHPYETEVVLLN